MRTRRARARARSSYASRRDDIIGAPCSSATSRSKVRSARARPRSQNGSAPGSTRPLVLEETENPFLADFYARPPGRRAAGAALLPAATVIASRRRCSRRDLFSQTTVSDYLFDKDKIFAYLNLDDNELFIYQRLYDLLARDVPRPDLVIYLQAPTDVLLRRLRSRRVRAGGVTLRTRRRIPAGAERGVSSLLLSLRRDAAARRRDVAVRFRRERRGARRSRASRSPTMGVGHAVLRARETK